MRLEHNKIKLLLAVIFWCQGGGVVTKKLLGSNPHGARDLFVLSLLVLPLSVWVFSGYPQTNDMHLGDG